MSHIGNQLFVILENKLEEDNQLKLFVYIIVRYSFLTLTLKSNIKTTKSKIKKQIRSHDKMHQYLNSTGSIEIQLKDGNK